MANDGDEFTEVQSSSWLQRLGQSFAGVLFGILLIIAACVLIFWNEGRAVKTARSLAEGAGLVHTVASDKPDSANDGKLVHMVGQLTTTGPATDPEFGVKSSGVILLRRAEMFQWTEESESDTEKRLGGGETTKTTYKYKRDWNEHPVDSSKFKQRQGHTNPQMTYRTRNVLAPGIRLGAFAVPQSLMHGFGSEQPLSAGDEQVQAVQKRSALHRQGHRAAGGRRLQDHLPGSAAADCEHRRAPGRADTRALSHPGRRHRRADRGG